MLDIIFNFFKKYNLKPAMTIYLAYSHILALIGLVYAIFDSSNLLKVIFILSRFLPLQVFATSYIALE
jgi:hypothetical protein